MSSDQSTLKKRSNAHSQHSLWIMLALIGAFAAVLTFPADEEYSATKLDAAVTADFGAQMKALHIDAISSPHCFGVRPDDDAVTRVAAKVNGSDLVFAPTTALHGCVGFQARRELDGKVHVTFQADPDKVPYDDVHTAVYARLTYAVTSIEALLHAQANESAKEAAASGTWK